MSQPTIDLLSNRRYKTALMGAVLLFFATLTVTILVILIANAREQDRETEFEMTLTSVSDRLHETAAASLLTPTPAPPLVYGRFPFDVRDGSPATSAADTCDQQTLTGHIYDQQGDPTDAFSLLIWGDYLAPQTVLTGEFARLDEGQWMFALGGMLNRRLWVQITAANRTLSAPVEIVFEAGNCEQNRVEIVFEQIAPLD